jgi:type I restriction enzyme, S subunit
MNTSKSTEPTIRFPDFKEPWEAKLIERVLEKRSIAVDVEPSKHYTQIGIRSHGKGIFHKEPVTGMSLGNKRVFWVQSDCLVLNIVFAWEHAVGKTTEREVGLIASHRFPMYAPKRDQVDIDFMVRFFLRSRGKYLLGLASPGGAGRNRTLGQKEFDKLKVVIPALPEQQKISDFLAAVDGRLQLLIRKKALLEEYKKGVMQQLFTKVIRFKDDQLNDFPDWEEKTLGEISNNVAYGMNAAATKYDGVTKYIRITDIDGNSNKFRPDPVTSPDREPGDQYRLRRGDIVFARTGASVGKSYLYDKADGNLVFAGFLIRFSICKGVAHPVFVFLQMQTQRFWRWVRVYSMRSGQPGINSEEYKTFPVQLPSLAEQEKIADFLSTIDRKIESVATQITETQSFKHGLLQQMFV